MKIQKISMITFTMVLSLIIMSCMKTANKRNDVTKLTLNNFNTLAGFSFNNLDSMHLTFQGELGESYSKGITIQHLENIAVEDLPDPGAYQLEVVLYHHGIAKYLGRTEIEIVQGVETQVQMLLKPLFARLAILVPTGADNPKNITSGLVKYILASDTIQITELTDHGLYQSFTLEDLPLNEDIEITIDLYNDEMELVYQGQDILHITESKMYQTQIALSYMKSEGVFNLELMDESKKLVDVAFSNTNIKDTILKGDVLFSEFMANPKVSGSDYEWIELVNTSFEQVNLKECFISKNLESTTSSNQFEIKEDLWMPSTGAVVLGRDSMALADFHFQTFTLSNTSQNLYLICSEQIIDSLSYHAEPDSNAVSVDVGASTELNLERYLERNQPENWCLSKQEYTVHGQNFRGTPGTILHCK